MKYIALLIGLVILRCCWGPNEYQIMQDKQNTNIILKELNGIYNINTLNNEDVTAYNLSISFNDSTQQVSGFSGCNRFFGSYTLSKNSLKFSPLGATRMLCSEDKNTLETQVLNALENADTVFFSENGFSLFNKKTLLLSAVKTTLEKQVVFEYSATSRGTYKHIKIEKDTIRFSKKRNATSLKIACSTPYWSTLIKLYDDINLENISDLEAPSKAFQYDGAAIAHLKIISNGKIYESTPFDHGNPPKEIASLVKEILSSTENIE